MSILKSANAESILDLGCGEGKLLKQLLKDRQFKKIVGMDVSIKALEIAADRLHLEDLPPALRQRVELMHGSLMYRDRRLEGFDAAVVVEVVEHLDEPRLRAFERVVFEFARPKTIALTTPNQEYNIKWENIGAERLRHKDHRFEWTREEFKMWSTQVAQKYGYQIRFLSIGDVDAILGAPTQMGIFIREGR